MPTRIAFTDPAALAEHCEITSAHIADDASLYDTGAVIPHDDWQALSPQQANSLRADPDTDPGTVVELVTVPIDRAAAYAMLPITATSFDPFAGKQRAEFLAYADQPAGARTTTTDPAIDRRIGLHVDNFDRLAYTERTSGRRRLGINFGPGPRYLLLATIDILDICHTLNPEAPHRYPHTDDIRAYAQAGHHLHCLRLRLDPGQGYIAPTELIPHDGSTWHTDQPSRIAFWLGHWPTHTLPTLI
jgi:hypothetical protein